eukprot:5488562-Pyramimonas_sp.AAC.1
MRLSLEPPPFQRDDGEHRLRNTPGGERAACPGAREARTPAAAPSGCQRFASLFASAGRQGAHSAGWPDLDQAAKLDRIGNGPNRQRIAPN